MSRGTVERRMPTPEADALIELTRELAEGELLPFVDKSEEEGEFPRERIRALGRAGLLSLPYDEAFGGGGQPYEVYLQVLEEISQAWLSVGISVSVHGLSCFPVAMYGTDDQKERWLPDMLAGDSLGAYCLSEPQSGSDAAALTTRAELHDGEYRLSGSKAWITHGDVADFYNVMARTGGSGPQGISCLLVDRSSTGVEPQPRERKMGAWSSPTAGVNFTDVPVASDRLLGEEGQGFSIAMSALDAGRLGIAACAVGLAQAAIDTATTYAQTRQQFGRPIADFQGLSFMMADMATSIAAARALYLDAARRKDDGLAFGTQAAMAKLFATDVAMRVTTDAIQVLGGYGYTRDFPVERYFREAKVLQIVEGTNQIQRMVIGRSLTHSRP
jgi:alkylation response protein AidB-like acyl-CoA dehydrogenase